MSATDNNEDTAAEPSPAKPTFPIQPDVEHPGRYVAVAVGRTDVFWDRNKDDWAVPPDFTVFRADDHGWVLRDHDQGKDYPFHSREAAIAGVNRRLLQPSAFIGADSAASVYGEPQEQGTVLVFA